MKRAVILKREITGYTQDIKKKLHSHQCFEEISRKQINITLSATVKKKNL